MAGEQEIAVVLKLVADEFKRELGNSKGVLADFQRALSDWKTQATAAGTALFAIAKSAANYGDEALKAAQKTGTTVESFTAMRHAAQQSGLAGDQFQQVLVQLNRHMGEAAGGSEEVRRTFTTLGVQFQDNQGHLRATDQVLLDLAERFRAMGPSAEATALSMQVFGRSGAEALQFLFEGKGGIQAFMEEARRLGIVMSKEDAQAADSFNDELEKLQAALRGLTLTIGTPLLEPFRKLVELMKELAASVAPLLKDAFTGLTDIFDRIGTKIRQAGVALEFFRGNLSFADQLTQIQDLQKGLEERAATRLLEMQGKLPTLTPKAEPTGGAGVILADQEKLGKKIVEAAVSLAKSKEEIEKILGREQEQLGRAQLFNDLQNQAEFARFEQQQEGLGRAIVQSTVSAYRMRQQEREADHQREIDEAKTMLAEVESMWSSNSTEIAEARIAVFEAMRKRDLDQENLTEAAKARIHAEWDAKIKRESAFTDSFSGLVAGLSDYVRDHDSAFGIMRDMARQTASAMQGFFKNFFFDAIEGRIRSFKDVVRGVTDFVKQLLVQVAAQVATIMTLRLFLSGATGGVSEAGFGLGGLASLFANQGGLVVKRFGFGGAVFSNGDSVPALLQRGEYVLRSSAVEKLDRLNNGDVSALGGVGRAGQVTVNVHGVPQGTRVRSTMFDELDGRVINIILENMAQNGALRRAFG